MPTRLAANPTPCPSCRAPMQPYAVAGHLGVNLELDLCHACHGIWFDGNENLRMSPQGVMDLFRHLHEHRDDAHAPLAQRLGCPRCRRALAQGVDMVKRGRYFTHRCPERHGRFSTFSSFMIEKGFVRQLTPPEIEDLAQRVQVIHCTSCGAPVDLRKEHACSYCRSALSLLDPQAVEKALSGLHRQAQRIEEGPRPTDLADALVSIERDRERQRRQEQQERWSGQQPGIGGTGFGMDDLWSAGLELVWNVLKR